MAWLHKWAWRLSVLILPWQIRYFSEGPAVGGMPWEQGRLSLYLSWLPMLLTIFVACQNEPDEDSSRPLYRRTWIWLTGLLLLTLPACLSIFPQASWQWFIQVSVLAMFGWSLERLAVPMRDFFTWFILSLIPHALLGIWQYATQMVVGSKWLGMSPQNPLTPGVSVVEAGGRRILRAYGGFPHPNIFGGWLAFGLAAVTLLASRVTLHQRRIALAIVAALFAVALVFTFSRSAWIAAGVGVTAAFIGAWRKAWTLEEKLRLFLIPCAVLVSFAFTAFAVREVVAVRATAETRLETKSTDERALAIDQAWQLFSRHPVLGIGEEAALLALDRGGLRPVPPHQVLLLILLETGILGSLGLLLILGCYVHAVGPKALFWLLPAVPLLLFDHYLWSLWSGQVLACLFLVAPLTRDKT